jgi:hypothetical protein
MDKFSIFDRIHDTLIQHMILKGFKHLQYSLNSPVSDKVKLFLQGDIKTIFVDWKGLALVD